jgi:hydrogenase 3 maturation protease
LKRTNTFQYSHYLSVGTNPENYLTKILSFEPDIIVFIDAVRGNMIPGTISWIDKNKISGINISTHAFSIKLVEDFLRQQKNIEIKYLGIEPQKTNFGSKISAELIQSVDEFFNEAIN